MTRSLLLATVAVALAACVDSTDPADGGFFNGISGVTSGEYDARVEEREKQVAEEKARNAALRAELSRLRGEHSAVKNEIVQRRAALASAGVRLSPASERQVQAALAADPQKVESLRKAIADARELSARLARMAG